MNRKWFLISAVFVVLSILSPYSALATIETDPLEERMFKFPSSLLIIEDEAFEGTSVENVILPDGLISIGSGAFEGIDALTGVYIPSSVTYIAESAFAMTADLTIHGIDESYAEDWAEHQGIPFVVDDIWNVFFHSGSYHNTLRVPVYRYIAMLVLVLYSLYFR